MRKMFEIGGLLAAAVLIAFGVGALVMGFNGRTTVQSSLTQEQIVGSPDMTPPAIAAEAKKAGLPSTIACRRVDVAGMPSIPATARACFASYMRIHALEATGGLTYSQMPRFATDDGKGTNDAAAAMKGPTGAPLDNPARSHLDQRDGAQHRAQLQLHGRADRALRHRRRHRAAALGPRLRDPRDRRGAAQPGDLAPLRPARRPRPEPPPRRTHDRSPRPTGGPRPRGGPVSSRSTAGVGQRRVRRGSWCVKRAARRRRCRMMALVPVSGAPAPSPVLGA